VDFSQDFYGAVVILDAWGFSTLIAMKAFEKY
jgi:hypothetical protein